MFYNKQIVLCLLLCLLLIEYRLDKMGWNKTTNRKIVWPQNQCQFICSGGESKAAFCLGAFDFFILHEKNACSHCRNVMGGGGSISTVNQNIVLAILYNISTVILKLAYDQE